MALRGDLSAFEFFASEKWNMYGNDLDAVDKPSTLLSNWTGFATRA